MPENCKSVTFLPIKIGDRAFLCTNRAYISPNGRLINKDDNMATEEWNFSDVNVVINKAVEIPKKEKNELKHDYDDRCMNIIMKSIANSLPNKYRGVYE